MGNQTNQLNTLAVALNFTLQAVGDSGEKSLPEFLMLVPAGGFAGRDGREYANPDAQSIVNFIVDRYQKDIQIDINHSSELKAPFGDPAPAIGWIKAESASFEIRDDVIFGRVSWNQSAKTLLIDDAYRYYSPVYILSKSGNAVIGVTSVGLTNDPNLFNTSLNHRGTEMDLSKLIAALALASEATLDDCVTAVNQLKAENVKALNAAQTPSLEKFVPRGDYNIALNRADAFEKKLKNLKDTKREEDIEVAINAALKDKKITPASVEYHKARCRMDEGGLKAFSDFVDASPIVIADADFSEKPGSTSKALNAEEKTVCKQLGVSEADFIKSRDESNAQ